MRIIILLLCIGISQLVFAGDTIYSYATLNILYTPSIAEESLVLGVMNIGDSAVVISELDDWYKVNFNDITGYVFKQQTGKSYFPMPILKTTFIESSLSYIISVNTDKKLLAIIDDMGYCGPSDETELCLVVYDYGKGERLELIHLGYNSEIYMAHYHNPMHQQHMHYSWQKNCLKIQNVMQKYGFQKVYNGGELDIIQKVDAEQYGYTVAVDSLSSEDFGKWLAVRNITCNNKEVWTSETIMNEQNFPTPNYYSIIINNEKLLFGIEYLNEADCNFYHRIVMPISD